MATQRLSTRSIHRAHPVSFPRPLPPSPAHSGVTRRVVTNCVDRSGQCAACMHLARPIRAALGGWRASNVLRACILGRAYELTVDTRVRPAREQAQDLVRTCLTARARFRLERLLAIHLWGSGARRGERLHAGSLRARRFRIERLLAIHTPGYSHLIPGDARAGAPCVP